MGWLQTFNDKGDKVDLEGTALLLSDGNKAYLREDGRYVSLKCMPSEDVTKLENYIKFLKRR